MQTLEELHKAISDFLEIADEREKEINRHYLEMCLNLEGALWHCEVLTGKREAPFCPGY